MIRRCGHRVVIPAKRGSSDFGFFFASNAFAFGELLFFEGSQRKVTAPSRDLLALMLGAPPRAWPSTCVGFASNAFAFGELLFFDSAQRKVTKRKGAFPTQLNRQLESSTDFQTRHPWLG